MYAPDPKDPGQFLRLRTYAMNLICALAGFPSVLNDSGREVSGPPDHQDLLDSQGPDCSTQQYLQMKKGLEIKFVNAESASWYNGASAQKSVPQIQGSDVEQIVELFQYLRNVERAKITVPTQAIGDQVLEKLIAKAETAMMSPTAFGSPQSDNSAIKAVLAERTVYFDMSLDYLPGRTAAYLRRKRFEYWYPYEVRIRQLIRSANLTPTKSWRASDALEIRCNDRRVWDPMSKKLRVKQENGSDPEMLEDNWWRTRYRRGIPVKGSREWRVHMNKYSSVGGCNG